MKWTDYNGTEHYTDEMTMLALKTCMDPARQCVECPFNDKEQACYSLNAAHIQMLKDRKDILSSTYGEFHNEHSEE